MLLLCILKTFLFKHSNKSNKRAAVHVFFAFIFRNIFRNVTTPIIIRTVKINKFHKDFLLVYFIEYFY